MLNTLPLWDICENRHKGNIESLAANPTTEHKRDSHERILNFLRVNGNRTSKELAYYFGKQLNVISGRISELKAIGAIEPTGERRDGAAVLRLKSGTERSTSPAEDVWES